MANQNIDEMTDREADALTWQAFFMRPGERPMDAEGYWSTRLGVRLAYPQYANDAGAASKIEAELARRGLRKVYARVLLEQVGAQPDSASDAAAGGDEVLQSIVATPDQRRRAALKVIHAA